jgi:2-methylcitrate dehydratase PrpD
VAQYNLPFPVAAALVRGELRPTDISGASLHDPDILSMSERIRLVEDAELSRRFPAERYARARITLADGRVFATDAVPARGDAERPLSDAEIDAKYMALAAPVLGLDRAARLREEIASLPDRPSTAPYRDLSLLGPTGATQYFTQATARKSRSAG